MQLAVSLTSCISRGWISHASSCRFLLQLYTQINAVWINKGKAACKNYCRITITCWSPSIICSVISRRMKCIATCKFVWQVHRGAGQLINIIYQILWFMKHYTVKLKFIATQAHDILLTCSATFLQTWTRKVICIHAHAQYINMNTILYACSLETPRNFYTWWNQTNGTFIIY